MVDLALSSDNGARRPAKSPDAFRTISEVAEELDVPQHVLRFWETKFNQIRPLKRGGGRRYYRPEDVDLLRRVRALLYSEGYTIKGVQKLLRENGRNLPVAPATGAPQSPLQQPQAQQPQVSPPHPAAQTSPAAVVVPLAVLANPPAAALSMLPLAAPIAAPAPAPVAKEQVVAPARDQAALDRAVAELEAIRRELLVLAGD